MSIINVIGDGIKGLGHTATGVISGLTQSVVSGAASMWKMAFGEETGVIVDSVAQGANTLLRGAEGVANTTVDTAVGTGGSLIASLGNFSPPNFVASPLSTGTGGPAVT